jgi:CBS domain-containing protein
VALPDSSSQRIPREQALAMTVGEVMIARPKTLPADARVADVRRMFAQSSQRTVLLAHDGAFRGAIERDRLPPTAPDGDLAQRYADIAPATVTPDMTVEQAVDVLDVRTEPRVIVLDADGVTLRGLLCFNRSTSGFCVR